MAKFEFKGLKDKLQNTLDSAKKAVQNVDLSDVKEKLQETGAAAVETANKLKETVGSKVEELKANIEKKKDEDSEAENDDSSNKEPENRETVSEAVEKAKIKLGKKKTEDSILNIRAVSTRNAIKIIYYLMAADGQIYHMEEEKFDSIGRELDPKYNENKEAIVKECELQLKKVIDVEDYYDVLQDGVEDALLSSKQTADTFITPKLLIWDLLTVAYSDESYDETERKLIKYIVRKTNIDKAVFLEMESSILTLMDIEKEISWIKTTNRPYLTIEAMVNELVDRRNVIFESVKDLIAL